MDNIQAVKKMQDYIRLHHTESEFSIEKVCEAVGYSRRHADRILKSLTGMTLKEYCNAVCLSQSAVNLVDSASSVLDVALQSHFESHEGFSRAFRRQFHVMPAAYRKSPCPIPLFVQYPISHYFALIKHQEDTKMNEELNFCMVTIKERPKRKLIFLPSRKAEDYFSYCKEVGCEWEGMLNSIPEKYDVAALIELPDFLVRTEFSRIAAGVEVPFAYDKPIPEGYEVAELSECVMLYFQSEPYEDENDFCRAIESVYAAIDRYHPESFGYTFAHHIAPRFNFGADTNTGAIIAVPAIKNRVTD